jgi:hypothetical protein
MKIMRRIFRARLLASALIISALPFVATAVPACAQEQWDVSFDSFHDQLAQYGDWVYSDRWGLVWQPADVPDDFRPYYSGGHWAYTDDYGWTWDSDYEWGDVAFHYGRWVDDPYDGWMWIPGYSWSPGWVVWRSNQMSIGWMPMPPDDDFLDGRSGFSIGISLGGWRTRWNDTSDDYGYSRWYGRDYDQRRFAASWTFVDTGHMADRDYRRVAYAPDRVSISIRQTTNITNYTVVNNYMVNRSVDVHTVERASGHPVATVAAATVFKHPSTVLTVEAGQKIHAQEFSRAPHGSGIANSAPPPPPAVINTLSDHVATHHAGASPGLVGNAGGSSGAHSHVFTKATITTPAATTQFHGKLPAGGPANAPTPPPGLHTGPAAPVTTKVVPDTGPRNGSSMPDSKTHLKHTDGSSTGPADVPAGKPEKVLPLEQKIVPPPASPVAKPADEPAIKRMDHRNVQPVAEPPPPDQPAMKHMERKIVQPVTEPPVNPPAQPAMKRMERNTVHPAPTDHNPPPAAESGKPAADTPDGPNKDEPKKGKHKNDGPKSDEPTNSGGPPN